MNVLMLRGWTREVRHWGDFPEHLKELNTIDDVVCLDLPGAGKRNRENSPTDVTDYVNDLRGILGDRLQKGEWSILAISLGGMIALKWCQLYPNDFKKCVVINISAKNLSNPFKRLSASTMGFVIKSLYDQDLFKRELGIKKLTTNLNMDEKLIDQWVSYAKENPVSVGNALKQVYAAAKFEAPFDISVPLLILASQNDHIANIVNSKNLASKIKNSEFKVHNLAGHDLPLDDPMWVIEQVKPFFK